MPQDNLVREVRTARDAYCHQFGYDLTTIVRDLQERERLGSRRVVTLPTHRLRPGAEKPKNQD